MFDLGWFELAIVGALLLVVVGPKDLPRVLRAVGVWTGKARRMARDFQRALDDYAKEAELDGVKKAVEAPGRARKAVTGALDPGGGLKKQLAEAGSGLRDHLQDTGEAARPETTAKTGASDGSKADSAS